MKTVCPNCHQKYDVPDDYLQQEVSCEKCQHDFFVTQAKFCSECGAANPQQVFECRKCNKSFAPSLSLRMVSRPPETHVPAPIPSVIPMKKEETVLDNISPWYKREVRALGIFYLGYSILGLLAFLSLIFLGVKLGITVEDSKDIKQVCMIIGISVGVVLSYQYGCMFKNIVNPECTLRWSWFEKIFVFLYLLGLVVGAPFALWNAITSDINWGVKIFELLLFFYIVHCSFIAWKIYRARLEEQEAAEE